MFDLLTRPLAAADPLLSFLALFAAFVLLALLLAVIFRVPLRRLLAPIAGLGLLLLAACSTLQTGAVAVAGCQGWNEAERVLGPKLPVMTETEHRLFLRGFATLTGGTPLAKTNKGLCRQPTPPDQATVVAALVDATMAELQPLLAKYTAK